MLTPRSAFAWPQAKFRTHSESLESAQNHNLNSRQTALSKNATRHDNTRQTSLDEMSTAAKKRSFVLFFVL